MPSNPRIIVETVTVQDDDGTTTYVRGVPYRPKLELPWEVSLATRARNKQTPPAANTPEHFYRNERYGCPTTDATHRP